MRMIFGIASTPPPVHNDHSLIIIAILLGFIFSLHFFVYTCKHHFLYFPDAAFIAGIAADPTSGNYHFDVPILNPGGHSDPSGGNYTIPYNGLYQFTIAFECYTDLQPKFYLLVDGTSVAYMKNFDDTYENSLIMTRN